MSENEYMEFTPPIPVADGWDQMQMLLDEHMPAQLKKRTLTYLWLAAAILGLLLAAMPLKETMHTHSLLLSVSGRTAAAYASSSIDTLQTINAAGVPGKNAVFLPAMTIHPRLTLPQDNKHIAQSASYAHLPVVDTIDHKVDQIEKTDPAAATFTALQQEKCADEKEPLIKNAIEKKSKWSIFAGASVNIVASEKTKSFQPYPSVEVRYAVNDRFFVATGLSALSPVTTSTTALEKSYLVNDTLNNVRLYNENVVYQRFHYMDIPLTLGMNITKSLSVSAGMQASILLFSSSYSKAESYDFQMNRFDLPTSGMLAPLAVVTPQTYAVENRKVECRYSISTAYRLGRFHIDAGYQHALAPAVKGEYVQTKKNELFTVGLKYRIK